MITKSRKVDGPKLKRLKKQLWTRDSFQKEIGRAIICHICGAELGERQFTIDHIVRRAEGGKNHVDNLKAACAACNHKRQ